MTGQLWLGYLAVTVVCFLVFNSIKEDSKNWTLKAIRGLSAVIGCLVGITFAVMTLGIVLTAVFPNFMNSPVGGSGDTQCERDPLFGGCN